MADIKGLSELQKNFDALAKTGQDNDPDVQALLLKAADIVRFNAKRNAPVASGKLRDSIVSHVGKSGKRPTAVVETAEYYAAFVEFGTEHMNAQPFMRPALAASKSEVFNEVGQGVKTILDKVTK